MLLDGGVRRDKFCPTFFFFFEDFVEGNETFLSHTATTLSVQIRRHMEGGGGGAT